MIKEEIHSICKKYNITNYTINEDLSIDVFGNVNLSDLSLSKIPLKFRNVTGWFECPWNNLTSLEGSPISVKGDFLFYKNNLTSLVGAPREVGGKFDCSWNDLTSLEGSPNIVGRVFDCKYNPLESLKGIPLNLTINKLSLPRKYTYSDYMEYCKVIERDLKFKKILK